MKFPPPSEPARCQLPLLPSLKHTKYSQSMSYVHGWNTGTRVIHVSLTGSKHYGTLLGSDNFYHLCACFAVSERLLELIAISRQ